MFRTPRCFVDTDPNQNATVVETVGTPEPATWRMVLDSCHPAAACRTVEIASATPEARSCPRAGQCLTTSTRMSTLQAWRRAPLCLPMTSCYRLIGVLF